MKDAIIIVPCYNEAARLNGAAFREFAAVHPGVSFLFVDDGSRDGTAAVLRQICGELEGRADVLSLERNSGKAEAVRQGVLRALKASPAAVGFWDADLATPLSAIPEFIDILRGDERVQMVFGARVKLLGREIERSAVRHYVGRVFATAISLSLHLPIYDSQCGAKLLRTTPALGDYFAQPFLTRWIFDVELVARAMQHDAGFDPKKTIYELPLREWRDVAGSKLRAADFALAGFQLLRIHARYRRRRT